MNPLEALETLDLRIGRILRAELNQRARKPSYKLWIDFGPLGQKTSSAQLPALYRAEELVGRLIVAAVNLGARNVAGFTSEVLVLGVPGTSGETVLLAVEQDVPLGGRVY
jgi:tRNA-binding protein